MRRWHKGFASAAAVVAVAATLLLVHAGCNGDDDRSGEGEGEGEGEADLGPQDLGPQDLGPQDLAPPDAGDEADNGIDEWEDQVRKKDGIGPRARAPQNEELVVVYTRPVPPGASRRLCWWRGADPNEPGEEGCLDLRIGNPSTPYLATDGTWVTFVEAGGPQALLANLETGEIATVARVMPGDDFQILSPVVAPGGSPVVYQKVMQGATHMALLDRSLEPAVEHMIWEQQGATGAPSLSADAQQIVFHSDPTGNNDVWRWDATLGESTSLTSDSVAHEKDPRIARDGSVICFRQSAQPEGRVGQIVVAADGRLRDITSGYDLRYLNNHDCQVSATGRHVVFRSLPGQTQPTRWMEGGVFYVYDLNADMHRQLPEPVAADKSQAHSLWRLSSDGRWIVFTALPVGGSKVDLWALDVRTGHSVRILHSLESLGTGAPAVN